MPARDEPVEHVARGDVEIGGEKGLGVEFAGGIAHEQPADRHGRLAAVIPDGGAAGDLDLTLGSAIPQRDGMPVPDRRGIVQELGQLGQLRPFERRSSAPAAFGRGWGKQVGVEAQAGDDTHVTAHSGEEFESGTLRQAQERCRRR